jgi:predicted regulator of Ras-like GTPase activity (Roadblock/LC7/MglB family)
MTTNGTRAEGFEWLLTDFVQNTAGVTEATAVSSDGLLLGSSAGRERANLEQLAALVSGMASLARGAVEFLGHRHLINLVIETTDGYLFLAQISDGSTLAVEATPDCDLGLVGYETILLVERVGDALTPELLAELKNMLIV